jgi:macrolide transport system ATP-binding/permease protein
MAFIGEWIRRLNYLLRRGAVDDELRREMESHRALMGNPQAFGNTLRLRDEARDAWGWRWLEDFAQDTRFALRTLRHSPGFALTAVVTLALGIGVNIGMFSFVNGLLLRPLYANADEVVMLDTDSTTPSGDDARDFSYPNYRDIQEGTTDIFASLAAYSINVVGLDAGNGARSALAAAVTGNYFQVLSAPPAHGRSFTAEEERPGAGIRVAIISYQLWEQLGAGADTLGRLARINGEQFTVVGVARDGFLGTGIPGPEIWLPMGVYEIFSRDDGARTFGSRESHALTVIGRLRRGISKDRAGAAVATVGRRLEQAFPAVNAG